MNILLNGKTTEFPSKITVAQLLAKLDYDGRCVAVAVNGEVVARRRFCEAALETGDAVEVLLPAAGG